MMYPLVLCSIIMLSLIIERAVTLRKASVDGEELLEEIKKIYTPGGDATQAMAVCKEFGGPVGRMFARGLKNAKRSADAIEMAMEQEAANETPGLEANLPIVKTIINIAPLLGLLGTIAGMITAFRAASAQVFLIQPRFLAVFPKPLFQLPRGSPLLLWDSSCTTISPTLFGKLSRIWNSMVRNW